MGAAMSAATPSLDALGPDFPKSEAVFFGFQNFGATCYVNSVLVALYHCRRFRDAVLRYGAAHEKQQQQQQQKRKKDTLLLQLAALFMRIRHNKKRSGVLSPSKFVKKLKQLNPQFEGYEHQDAQEFLNFLLNEVSDNLRADAKEEEAKAKAKAAAADQKKESKSNKTDTTTTWVQQIFEGVLTNETHCLRCENTTSRDEQFIDLSLDVTPNSSLTHCLRQFSGAEMLNGSEKYLCATCCSRQEAYKSMKVKQSPRTLVLHMKRFKYVERLQTFRKLCHRVVFPFDLKLVNVLDDAACVDAAYNLIAVVVHKGASMRHGHYVCFVKQHTHWFLYDDESVQLATLDDIKSTYGSIENPENRDGYLLFYQRA
jgi:ubiquitin carboxyl-terminal hydrolase 12/46